MNKGGITPTQLMIRIVIIIIVLVVLLLVSFSMIKLIPKVFSSIANLRNLIHTNATSTATTTATTTNSTVSSSTNKNINNPQNTKTASSSYTVTNTSQTKNNSRSNLNVTFTKSQIINSRGTIIFKVTNIGTKNSGVWKLSAILPHSSGTQNYNSPNQTNIPVGKTSILTLNFDNAKKGTATITINGKAFTTQVN